MCSNSKHAEHDSAPETFLVAFGDAWHSPHGVTQVPSSRNAVIRLVFFGFWLSLLKADIVSGQL